MPETDDLDTPRSGMTLVTVVVSFNRLEHLKKGVQAVLDEPVSGLVVVDNGSTDGSREWLASLADPRLKVLMPEHNLGGAGGFELGFREAIETFHPDWLVCFDDDARPAPGALDRFMQQDLDGIDGAAAAVYYPDGRICEMNRPSWNPFWHPRLFLRTAIGVLTGRARQGFHVADEQYRAGERVDIDSSSFVGCFVRAAAVARIGLPRGELFIYGDDIIYTLSLSKSGGHHVFLPDIDFVHDCSAALHEKEAITPLWKAFYAYRNGLLMYRIAAGRWFPLVVPVKMLNWLLAVRHYPDKKRYLNLCWAALRDALRKQPGCSHDDLVKRYP